MKKIIFLMILVFMTSSVSAKDSDPVLTPSSWNVGDIFITKGPPYWWAKTEDAMDRLVKYSRKGDEGDEASMKEISKMLNDYEIGFIFQKVKVRIVQIDRSYVQITGMDGLGKVWVIHWALEKVN
jgi:hypothetical protein